MNERDRLVSFKEQNRGDDTGTVAFYKENAIIPFGFISMDNSDKDVYFNEHILKNGQCGKIMKGARVRVGRILPSDKGQKAMSITLI